MAATSFQRILVALDGSDCSFRALDFACHIAKQYPGCTLVLVHVIDQRALETARMVHLQPMVEEIVRTLHAAGESLLAEAEAVPKRHQVSATTHLEQGIIAQRLLACAKEQGCDLIVIGSHGRTGLQRVLLGSVAHAVAQLAPEMVLIVREGAAASAGA